MLRLGLYSLALLLAVVMASPAAADVINYGAFPGGQSGGSGPSWQETAVTGGLITPANAYWNSTVSQDLGVFAGNLGNYMVAGDGIAFGGQSPEFSDTTGQVQWWGKSDGSADANIGVNLGSLGPNASGNLLIEVAGLAAGNEFGWYATGTPGILNVLFDGATSAPASILFAPGGDFGFYLKNTFGTFLSNEGGTADPGDQHFAIFRDISEKAQSMWVGVEDTPFGAAGCDPKTAPAGTCSDRDYQDLIVRIDAVPEPATLLLVGSSLLVLGFAGVRARRRS
jgi:hypothetical protein